MLGPHIKARANGIGAASFKLDIAGRACPWYYSRAPLYHIALCLLSERVETYVKHFPLTTALLFPWYII